jgi:hypothetical protein
MPEDNSQFEKYLRQFRPLPPGELLVPNAAQQAPRFRFWWAWAFTTAALLISALVLANFQSRRITDGGTSRRVETYSPPLTVGSANIKLFNAPSTNEALGQLTFPSQSQLPEGKTSALGVLGEEKTGL